MVQQIERELAVARAQVQNGGHDTQMVVCERERLYESERVGEWERALALKFISEEITCKWCV